MRFSFFILSLYLFSSLQSQGIPDSIPVYKNIKKIDVSDSLVIAIKLKHKGYEMFPEEIRKYSSLRYLDLSGNKINILPVWLKELKSLEYLKLSGNDFTRIDSSLVKLDLKYLDFGNNELDTIPDYIGEFNNLEYLILWSNNLVYFSDQLGKLSEMKKLDLRGMSIPYDVQYPIKESLPKAKCYFDIPCNCHD